MKHRSSRFNTSGFSLVEVLISAAILVIAVQLSVELYTLSDKMALRARVTARSAEVFHDEINRFLFLTFEELDNLSENNGGVVEYPEPATRTLYLLGPEDTTFSYVRAASVGRSGDLRTFTISLSLTWRAPKLTRGPIETKTHTMNLIRKRGGDL